MAAEIVSTAAQQQIGIRIAAGADDVVNAGTVRIPAVPAERVVTDGRHRPEIGHGAPEPVAGTEVGGMQRARLAAGGAHGESVHVPETALAARGAFETADPEEPAPPHAEGPGVAP